MQASTALTNVAMRRVLERLGYREEGTLRGFMPAEAAAATITRCTPSRARLVYDRAVNCEHVLVVGAGQMGGGIAQTFAASGRQVSLHDPFPGAIERGLATMEKSLTRLAEKGADLDPAEVLARVTPVDELVAADLMVEAATEDPDAKTDIFRRADEALPEHAILASNTSSIPIASLASVTGPA